MNVLASYLLYYYLSILLKSFSLYLRSAHNMLLSFIILVVFYDRARISIFIFVFYAIILADQEPSSFIFFYVIIILAQENKIICLVFLLHAIYFIILLLFFNQTFVPLWLIIKIEYWVCLVSNTKSYLLYIITND